MAIVCKALKHITASTFINQPGAVWDYLELPLWSLSSVLNSCSHYHTQCESYLSLTVFHNNSLHSMALYPQSYLWSLSAVCSYIIAVVVMSKQPSFKQTFESFWGLECRCVHSAWYSTHQPLQPNQCTRNQKKENNSQLECPTIPTEVRQPFHHSL